MTILQTEDGIHDAVANGSTVVNDATGSHVAVHTVVQTHQHSVVGGKRTLGVGFSCKDGQTDVVVAAFFDKLLSDDFQSLHTVGLEILCQHTGGHIDCQHDVNALGVGVAPGVLALRTSQNADY